MPVENLKDTSVVIEEEKPVFGTSPNVSLETPLGSSYVIIKAEGLERMAEEIETLKKKLFEKEETTEFRKISDSEARKKITDFILKRKEEGIRKIGILDIVVNLSLPAEQIEKIMGKFEKEKKVAKVL